MPIRKSFPHALQARYKLQRLDLRMSPALARDAVIFQPFTGFSCTVLAERWAGKPAARGLRKVRRNNVLAHCAPKDATLGSPMSGLHEEGV